MAGPFKSIAGLYGSNLWCFTKYCQSSRTYKYFILPVHPFYCQPGAEDLQFSRRLPVAQILQCSSSISHNAPFCNRIVHTCALWNICLMHCGICEMGLLLVLQSWYPVIIDVGRSVTCWFLCNWRVDLLTATRSMWAQIDTSHKSHYTLDNIRQCTNL